MAFTFADLDRLESGARFYTADLHVHTFGGSSDVTDSTLTVEAIIDAAVAANGGLLAATDHNNDKHVLSSLAYGANTLTVFWSFQVWKSLRLTDTYLYTAIRRSPTPSVV